MANDFPREKLYFSKVSTLLNSNIHLEMRNKEKGAKEVYNNPPSGAKLRRGLWQTSPLLFPSKPINKSIFY